MERPRTLIARFARSKWWVVVSTVAPALVVAGIGLSGIVKIQRDRASLQVIQAALADAGAHENDLAKKLAERATAVDKAQAELERLQQQLADRQGELEKLRIALSSPDVAGAIAEVRAQLSDRPPEERAAALYRRASAAQKLGRPDLAKQLHEAAIREDQTYALSLNALGLLAADKGDRKEAERMYLAAVDADPNYNYGLYNLANLYLLQRKLEKADTYCQRLQAADPSFKATADLLKRIERAKTKR
jgi:tetratricopeptide (TPR) repeat protein